jgi:hypothetical protein
MPGLADIVFSPDTFSPDVSSDAPVDGRDFSTAGGPGTELGGPTTYFPENRPDPVLAELRQAYEQQQGIQRAPIQPPPSMAGMSLAHAAAPPPQTLEQVSTNVRPEPEAPVAADPSVDALMRTRGALEEEALRDEAAAEKAASVARSGAQEARQRELETVEIERQKAIGAQDARVRQVTDEARNTKIDPERLWKNTSAPRKVAGFLAVLLGGATRTTTPGGRNTALDYINEKIKQDIDAQEADLDNLNKAVGHERSILGDLREQFQDKAAARAALHVIKLDQITNDFNAAMAGVKDVKSKARGVEWLQAAAEYRAEQEKAARDAAAKAGQQRFENNLATKTLKQRDDSEKADRASREKVAREGNATEMAKALLQFGPKVTTEADQLALREARAKTAKAEAEADGTARWYEGIKGGHGDDGKSIRIANPTEGTEVEGKVGGAQKTLDRLEDAKNILMLEGRANILDVDKRMGQVALANAITFMAQDEKGVPSDADVERIKTRIGKMDDPTKIIEALSTEERIKVLSYVQDGIRAAANDYVQSKTKGKGGFEYKARSLIGEKYDPKERNAETKVRDLAAASEDAPLR